MSRLVCSCGGAREAEFPCSACLARMEWRRMKEALFALSYNHDSCHTCLCELRDHKGRFIGHDGDCPYGANIQIKKHVKNLDDLLFRTDP